MKTWGALLLVLTTIALFTACGGEYKLKVEGLDNVGSGDQGGSQTDGQSGCSTASDQTGSAQAGSQTDGQSGCSTAGDQPAATTGGTDSQDPNDSSGGLAFLEPDQQLETPRYFMGTYSQLESGYVAGVVCSQGFPDTVRLYSHDEVIDLETTRGELFSIADVFEDKTFDFEVKFLDRFGKPSIDIVCTCYFNDAYYHYTNERFLCACDPSNDTQSCNMVYVKMDAGS